MVNSTKEVDPLVMLLAKIKENAEVMTALSSLREQEGRQSGVITPSTVDSYEERGAASGRPRALFLKNIVSGELG